MDIETYRRFMRKVNTNGPNGCWIWTASTKFDGYGQFGINGTIERSHRIMWEHINGPILDDTCVLHKCDNRRCVNPDHLFLGTRADNARDKVCKGRHPKGNDSVKSKLCADDIDLIRDLYSSKSLNQSDLAETFGISTSQISRIVRLENWRK